MKKLLLALLSPALTLCARAEAPPAEVQFIDHGKVGSLFAQAGGALLVNDLYKVQAGRRVAPGVVEVHTRDTDVFYIVEGSATFKTGGEGVGLKETTPGELRGASIAGGTERHLQKGDVIVIPNGTPHQFMQVDGPFLYFVVKVTKS